MVLDKKKKHPEMQPLVIAATCKVITDAPFGRAIIYTLDAPFGKANTYS